MSSPAPTSATPPHPVEPKIDHTLTDKVLGLSEVVLAGLAAAAGFIPVPFVADAIDFAAKLIEMANNAKKNIGMCKDLAYNACNVAYCAFRKCEDLVGKKGTDPEGHCSISAQLRDQLQRLMRTLQDIWKECEKICSRTLAGRLLFQSNDKDIVCRLSRRLDSAMVLFNFQSVMEIQEAIGKFRQSDPRQKKAIQLAAITSTDNSNNNIITYAGDNSVVYTNAGTYNSVNYLSRPHQAGDNMGPRAQLEQVAFMTQLAQLARENVSQRKSINS